MQTSACRRDCGAGPGVQSWGCGAGMGAGARQPQPRLHHCPASCRALPPAFVRCGLVKSREASAPSAPLLCGDVQGSPPATGCCQRLSFCLPFLLVPWLREVPPASDRLPGCAALCGCSRVRIPGGMKAGMEPSSSAWLCCLLAVTGHAEPFLCQIEGLYHEQLAKLGSTLGRREIAAGCCGIPGTTVPSPARPCCPGFPQPAGGCTARVMC